jgi:hypothetical protein
VQSDTILESMVINASGVLVKHDKKEIKYKSNSDKIIFYIFKTLNAQFSKKKSIIIC